VILTLNDGGEVAVDWRRPKCDGSQNVITVVILTGLTGDSQAEYVRETVNELYEKGYCCVVFNYRGRGGVKLKVVYEQTVCRDYGVIFANAFQKFSDTTLNSEIIRYRSIFFYLFVTGRPSALPVCVQYLTSLYGT